MEVFEEKIPEPTFTVYRGKTAPEKKYTVPERGWQAISTIEVTGTRLWAAWMAGGITEPDPNNYIILSFSDDGGKSWIDPFITVDNKSPLSRGRDPVLWLDPDGILWFFYGFNALRFTYAVKIIKPESAAENIEVTEPAVRFTDGVIINKPIVLSDGRWLCMFDPREETRKVNYCLQSLDKGETWNKIGEMYTDSAHKDWQEGHLVEKKDGTLLALLRIESAYNGGIERCFSYDKGRTWTRAENNLDYPFYGPGSKFCIRKLKSDNLLFINNNSNDKIRKNMSAYLSLDDGKTWKALLLDGRNGCAYPDCSQDDNGNIYVIFDCDRIDKYEIRFSKFTEDDIIYGKFGKNAVNMRVISRNKKYRDIFGVRYLSDNTAMISDENGSEYTVKGKFSERIINNEKYRYFDAENELAERNLTDGRNLLLQKI